MPASGLLIKLAWVLPSTGIMGMSTRPAQGVIETREAGFPSSPMGVRVRSMMILRVFRPQPDQRTVPSVPGSFATLEIPEYGVLPIKTQTYGVEGSLS